MKKIPEDFRLVLLEGYEVVVYPTILVYLSHYLTFRNIDIVKIIWAKLHGYKLYDYTKDE